MPRRERVTLKCLGLNGWARPLPPSPLTSGNSVQEIISWAVYLVDDDPSDMFSPHFLPQAERHHAGHDKDSFLDTLRQDRKLSLNPREVCFRKPDSSF